MLLAIINNNATFTIISQQILSIKLLLMDKKAILVMNPYYYLRSTNIDTDMT